MNKVKNVRFSEPLTSSSNIKQADSSKTSDSNTLVLSSTGLKCSTSTCRSRPTSNKKNDRISQTPSSNMKNKVEAQPRTVNKKNHVKEPICDANVKHTMLNANSQLIFVKCKQCMFDANHDVCFLDFVNDVNMRAKSKSKSNKNQLLNIWKPTGHMVTEIGYKWKPTGRLFTLVGNTYPLTRFNPTTVMPIKEYTPHSVETQKPELKVYSKRPKHVKNVGSNKKAKIVESKSANNSKPNHSWGSNATYILSSYSLINDRLSRLFFEGVDLLSGSRDTNLYTISLDDMLKTSPICLLSKASKNKSWLWHHRLSHLNFYTLNKLAKDGLARDIPKLKFKKDHMCSACALGKRKKSSHKPKAKDTNQEKLYLLHIDLCVKFIRSKDEAPDAIIKCIKNIQVHLNVTVRNVRTDNGTKFVNQTLHEFYENVDITHQTYVARTPQQNGIVERRNRTLVEAARTMFIFLKAPLFLWAKAINTACYTQNRSLICLRYNKTPYEQMHGKKPDLSFHHVFGSLCYPTNDSEDL
ncbi:retrovirus-related pol polyprotein from transposon TNT 1-94, partial [Tanacetum coccineum]